MNVTKRLTIDLLSVGRTDTVYAVQGDAYTRSVELDLRQGRAPWSIPDGVSVMVEYYKSDGTKGLYDTLPDGTKAWSVKDNVLIIVLAPQMLTASGSVATQVSITKDGARLSLFKFWIYVNEKIHGAESEDYINWRSVFLPQVEGAKAGQYFEIAEVDDAGRATKVKAVDAPQGGGVSNETDPTVPEWAKQPQKPTYTAEEVGALPADTEFPKPDWNASEGEPGHIANRTHWVEGGGLSDTIEWDGDLTGKETVVGPTEGGMTPYVVKFSDSYLTMEQLEGAALTVLTMEGEQTITLQSGVTMVDASQMFGVPSFLAGDGYVVSLSEDAELEGLALTKGFWCICVVSGNQPFIYVKSIKATAPIFGSETIHKLDNKFIDAEWMATYEEGIVSELTWDRSLDGREHYTQTEDLAEGYFSRSLVKMSDIVPTDEELKAATIEFTVQSPLEGGTTSCTVADLWPLMESAGCIKEKYIEVAHITHEDGGYTILSLAVVAKEEVAISEVFENAELEGVLSPGVYFVDLRASGTLTLQVYPKKLTVSGTGLVPSPIPEKFIPTTVPVIQTASPGQTIVVKSVDESGKPTEWEVVGFPTDDHINSLIDTALGVVENGTY